MFHISNLLMQSADVQKGFGAEVKRRRIQLGISQEKLAERANLHRTYVSDVEAGKRNPSLASIQRLTHVIHDGIEALDYVFCRGNYAKRPKTDRPQVVLLDLHLPKIHGLEVLRRIKADEFARKIPVVVLTVSQRDDHIHEALRLGAQSYIVKPVDFQNFSQSTSKLSFRWAMLEPVGT